MKAIAAHPPEKRSARLIDAPAPRPGQGEALLKIRTVGFDGTDHDIDQGVYGSAPPGEEDLIIGHEAVGEVIEIGDDAQVSVGDVVVPTVRRPCPQRCPNCRKGLMDRCSTGDFREHGIKGLHGFAAELAVTDSQYLVKVPPDVEDVAVLLEPLSIAESAITETYLIQRRMEWEPSRALVMGAGPLGLLAAMVLRLRGVEVSAAATRQHDSLKADIVRQMGGRYINVKEEPLAVDGGYDIIVEATGSTRAAMSALPHLARNGVVCILGIYPKGEVCGELGDALTKLVLENQLMFGAVNSNLADFQKGIEDMRALKQRYDGMLSRLITSRHSPEGYREALEPGREAIKAVIDF